MDQSVDHLCQRIEEVRANVSGEVRELAERARSLTDWRHYVQQHPWACVAGAFAAGYMLMPGRKKPASHEELVRLLKEHQVQAPTPGAETSRGLIEFALATVGPMLVRSAMNAASRRLMQDFSAPPSPSTAASPTSGSAP